MRLHRALAAESRARLRPSSRSQSGFYAAILLAALVLRVLMALAMLKQDSNIWFYSQASELGCMAQSLIEGKGLASPFCGSTGPSAFLAPGYPLLVSGVFYVFGSYSTPSAVILIAVNLFFALAAISVAMQAARALFGDGAAKVTGIIFAANPTSIGQTLLFWETTFSALALSAAVLMSIQLSRMRLRFGWAMLGVLFAFGTLVNPALLTSFVIILGCIAWPYKIGDKKGALLTLAAWLLLVAAWPIRNEIVLHSFVPLRSNLGYELWQGNRPGSDGTFSSALHPNTSRIEHSRYEQLGELAYMREKAELATAAILAKPSRFARLSLQRAVAFWTGTGSRKQPGIAVAVSCISGLLAISGLVALFRRDRTHALLLAGPLLIFPLPYYVTHANLRFHIVLEPILFVLSGGALDRGYKIFVRYSERRLQPGGAERAVLEPRDCGRLPESDAAGPELQYP